MMVTILALGTTASQCPYNGEVWTLNNGYRKAERFDKLFLCHKPPGTHLDWNEIRALDTEIISLHDIPRLKMTLYPLKKIVRKFHTSYFSDTLAYMIAYALYMEYDEIKLYGADMAPAEDYIWERPGLEYWIGRAIGMGVKVWTPPGSSICRTMTGRPYGTDGDNRIRVWKEVNAPVS